MTATTPIWGKLADLFSKKLLVQSALVIYSIGSLLAGFAPNMEVLIGARASRASASAASPRWSRS